MNIMLTVSSPSDSFTSSMAKLGRRAIIYVGKFSIAYQLEKVTSAKLSTLSSQEQSQ